MCTRQTNINDALIFWENIQEEQIDELLEQAYTYMNGGNIEFNKINQNKLEDINQEDFIIPQNVQKSNYSDSYKFIKKFIAETDKKDKDIDIYDDEY